MRTFACAPRSDPLHSTVTICTLAQHTYTRRLASARDAAFAALLQRAAAAEPTQRELQLTPLTEFGGVSARVRADGDGDGDEYAASRDLRALLALFPPTLGELEASLAAARAQMALA